MDKIKKLFLKINQPDRKKLLNCIQKLAEKDKNLNIIKIKNTNFYRLRSGKFRIIFHKEKKEIIIDSIQLRSENTYKNLKK